MANTIFWSFVAFGFLIITLVTFNGYRKVKHARDEAKNSPGASYSKGGDKFGRYELEIYDVLKTIVIADIFAFILSIIAALIPVVEPLL